MMRRIAWLFAFLLIAQCKSTSTPIPKPNVIIMMSDDQGWGDFSLHGNTNLHTPNIDKIARNGARFKNFYVAPVCSPTRAEMLTGRYHFRGGVYSTSSGGERLDLDEKTLADHFSRAGYATAAFGKWHNGMQSPYHPNARGFDEFYGFCSGHWGNYFDPMLEHNGQIVKGKGYLIDDLTNHAISHIEKNQHKPFLLYLPFNTPHRPMQVPDIWWNKFRNREIKMRSHVEGEEIDYTRAALAMCENIDWNVGRIVERLKELHLDENTIILYLNDNGPNSWRWNGRMRGRKGSTDEGGVRSPLFISWPSQIKAGIEISKLASVIDLLPTLCDLAGVPIREGKALDGRSLVPLLRQHSGAWPDRYILNLWNRKMSLRNQKYRMDAEGRIYDIELDRGQQNDLSETLPEIKEGFEEAHQMFITEIERELPDEDSRPFPLGDPKALYTQLPARDATYVGQVQRSNRSPNCSFLTNWKSPDDYISWDVDVLSGGEFQVTLYYTCSSSDVGSLINLSLGSHQMETRINLPYDPPLRGMDDDRVPRGNSYVKDWKPMAMGSMILEKGPGKLVLRALEIPGNSVMDFRMLIFERK